MYIIIFGNVCSAGSSIDRDGPQVLECQTNHDKVRIHPHNLC